VEELSAVTYPSQNSDPQGLIKGLLGKRTWVARIVIATFVVLFTLIALSAPNYEWDLLAYLANATQLTNAQPIESLHNTVYETIQTSVPPEEYAKLIGSPTRLVLSQDPEAFRQTIEFFYDSRVVYTSLLATVFSLGVDPVFSIFLISTLCAVVSILLLGHLIPVSRPIGVCFVLPFIALSCGLLDVARLATPDSLAAMTTIAMYFLLLRNRVYAILILLPLMIFIRTDLIILAGLFFGYLFFSHRISKVAIIASGLATVAAYLLLNHVIVEGDPWSSLIGYNYADKPTHPAEYVYAISASDYFSYVAVGLRSFSYNPIFFIFCMLTVIGIVLFSSRFIYSTTKTRVSQRHSDLLFLLISCMLYLVLHFILFPVTWIRFFAAQYSLVAIVVTWSTLSILAERNYSSREDMDIMNP